MRGNLRRQSLAARKTKFLLRTYDHREEFLVESVGQREEKEFIDFGIEYYRYKGEPDPAPVPG